MPDTVMDSYASALPTSSPLTWTLPNRFPSCVTTVPRYHRLDNSATTFGPHPDRIRAAPDLTTRSTYQLEPF